MSTQKSPSVLQRLRDAALLEVFLEWEPIRSGGWEYLKDAVMRSDELCANALDESWEFKSIEQLALEKFAHEYHWTTGLKATDPGLAEQISEDLGYTFNDLLWEVSNGLPLYILESSRYVRATMGNHDFAYVMRLYRSGDCGRPRRGAAPDWAKSLFVRRQDRRIHSMLTAAYADASDPKLSDETRDLQMRILEFALAQVSGTSPTTNIAESEVSPKERTALYKILLAMAMKGFDYDPAAKRNGAVSEIAEYSKSRGFAVSDDTVRTHLNAAADLLIKPVASPFPRAK